MTNLFLRINDRYIERIEQSRMNEYDRVLMIERMIITDFNECLFKI